MVEGIAGPAPGPPGKRRDSQQDAGDAVGDDRGRYSDVDAAVPSVIIHDSLDDVHVGLEPDDPDELAAQLKILREEVEILRRRLAAAPLRIRTLEERLLATRGHLQAAQARNAKLASTLASARDQLVEVRREIDRLSAPPSSYATVLATDATTATVTVSLAGRKLEVAASPDIDAADLQRGRQVLLNEAMNIVAVRPTDDQGDILTVIQPLDDGRVLAAGHGDDERVIHLTADLEIARIRPGDSLLVDMRANTALELIPKPGFQHLLIEEIPDVTYESIGGLGEQVERIRDAIELPFLHAELFDDHDLKPPKGILLYGPPGCGKTMIAKAVANSLARRVEERDGRGPVRSYFLNIKGPELLNKYVGETERHIRLIFQRAREKAAEGSPVIVFFDEMESLFRTRGSGVSSDVETTIVPQLLAEIDGVEQLRDVVIIGASNREDMIDPAILRPGRLDVKIKVDRPSAEAAEEIFAIYLHERLPLHADALAAHNGDRAETIRAMISATVAMMYEASKDNEFLEVTYTSGEKETLYFRDFNSGAMIENVVARAKKIAIKRLIASGERGLRTDDMVAAVREEFRDNEDLPNTTNPDDWARISGKKGERIAFVRTLVGGGAAGVRPIENVTPGQYL
ncbi:MAG: proteasome ATPase [Nitriliruptoraceae bacterium]